MQITKDLLESRREQITQQRNETVLAYETLGGALADIDYWLAQLAKEDSNAEAPRAETAEDRAQKGFEGRPS